MKFESCLGLAVLATAVAAVAAPARDYPIRMADMDAVKLTSGFWFDRLETNRTATLDSVWAKCFETPRIANFTNAARRACGTFKGIPFDDSDVYKVMEGTAYILRSHPDAELDRRMEWLIGEIAAAQEPDGYLYTARTLMTQDNGPLGWMMSPIRWGNIPLSHELYNVGHLYEAAVAWHRTSGRVDFLKIAEKNAHLIGSVFGPDEFQIHEVPGHEEIELALIKLYRDTGKRQYLDLAQWFVDAHGQHPLKDNAVVFTTEGDLAKQDEQVAPDAYRQNHRPVVEQRQAVGHAVRAAYLYCAMVDLTALTGDRRYAEAAAAIWRDVVAGKLHLNGGIGARPQGEAFGAPYELPNDAGETYLETCAAIGNVLWNERMFRLTGEAKYVDVMERTLYNGFVSGISLSGDEYFYPNPLASKGGYKRSKWFDCSCCPVNDVRFLPQIPAYAFATDGTNVYWNLFMAGTAEINGYGYEVKTDYPWSGKVELKVTAVPAQAVPMAFKVRIPGWATGKPAPGGLYAQTDPSSFMEVLVEVNGLALNGCPGRSGYLDIGREWKVGDVVTLDIPMPVKRIRARSEVRVDVGRLAVEKGPIVHCAEAVDNRGDVYAAALPADATFAETHIRIGDKDFPALRASNGLVLVPYCLWGNRRPGESMQVWFRE